MSNKKHDDPGDDLVPAGDVDIRKFLQETGIEIADARGNEPFVLNEDTMPQLTDKQKMIFKLRLRGFSQGAIAKFVGITQQAVSKHWVTIRKKFELLGEHVNQPVVVGESVSVYNEVSERAWELYYAAKQAGKLSDANKALNTVMTSREKTIRLLMDLGLLKRAAVEHDHQVTVSPLVKEWSEGEAQRKFVVSHIIETQLDDLEEPEPPMLLPDDIEDAVFTEPLAGPSLETDDEED